MNQTVKPVSRDFENPLCLASQEYTYGSDNTGTRYQNKNLFRYTLSDGRTFDVLQNPTTSWTNQLQIIAAAAQVELDALGIQALAEPRFIDNYNPSNIDGTINGPGGNPSGLPGAPSPAIAEELYKGGMQWRYVNYQICPGQPVITRVQLVEVNDLPVEPFDLTTAGAVLGPLRKFRLFHSLEKDGTLCDRWLIFDGDLFAANKEKPWREAELGEIPFCSFKEGDSAASMPPPERDCYFETDTACDSNGSDLQADYINLVTRRVTYCNGGGVTVDFFIPDPNDPAALIAHELVGEYVDCVTGLPIDEPAPPCENTTHVGNLWRLSDNAEQLMTVDYWGPPASYGGAGASAPHGNVSGIFSVSADGTTLEHVNGSPNATYTTPPGNIATPTPDFIAAVGLTDRTETNGTDQIRVSGYVVLNSPVRIKDTNPNTGERGGIWINRCCAGSLELLFEDTTDSAAGDTSIFDGLLVPAGIHYIEIVTSDLSAWQGFELSASYDDGATYEQLPIYSNKPSYNCLPILRCNDTGLLIRGDIPGVEVVTVGGDDRWCEPAACVAEAAATAPEPYSGPSAEEIAKANLIASRDSIEGRTEKFAGNAEQQLAVAPGQRGNLRVINDTGTGLVYFTTDGTSPGNPAGVNRGEVTGPYQQVNLNNIDLSLLRFDGSSTSSDYTVIYEVYI